MLIKFLRLLRGWVKFSFSGGFTQVFLNSCLLGGLPLRAVRRKEGEYTAWLPARDYHRIRPFAKKSGVRVRLVKKQGLPFWVLRHRRRYGIALGAAFFLFSLWFFPQFVWEIRISGNQSIPSGEIYGALEEIGVHRGMRLKDLDYDNLRQALILRLPSLSWCSLNMDGSVVELEVRERVFAPPTEETPCNLVAGCDGYIVQSKVYAGTPLVKAGDAVVKGDLLVSGVVEYGNGKTAFKAARGEILAQTEHEITVFEPFSVTEERRTGVCKTRRVLTLFHWKIPLYLGSVTGSYQQRTTVTEPEFFGHRLPLGIIRSDFFETEQRQRVDSPQEAEALARKRIQKERETLSRKAQLQKTEESVTVLKDGVRITQKIFCLEDLAERNEILILE